ncbi:MAG TPA: DUF6599 family protein [Bryobacteraceae bacterium]|nr:DUF6599 family protein [Bryobacteraceae bacterium]
MMRAGAAALACLLVSCLAASAAAPACNLVAGWTAQGKVRGYTQENLFEYMDGNSEGYLLYGFQSMQGVTCEKDGVTLVIDISDFGDAESAWGMFSATHDPGQPVLKLGMSGQIVPRRALLVKGKYYAEIAANPEGDYTETLRQWIAAIEKTLDGSSQMPAAIAWFPPEKQQSLRLVPESVLGIALLERGYVAQYDAGKAFVVEEESAASAMALMAKLRARFAGNTAAAAGDDGFQAADQYLGRLCIFRKGRYVAGYGNLAAGADGVALAQALAARIP